MSDLARRAYVASRLAVVVIAGAAVGTACGGGGDADSGSSAGGGGSNASGSDGGGGASLLVGTAGLLNTCTGDACVCRPGAASCADGRAKSCRADGSEWVEFECDALQGMRCEPDGCKGVCAPGELGLSYMGCDYFPTITLNPVWSGFPFAVAVANASTGAATVTVTRGASAVATRTLGAGSVETFELPWVAELKGGDVDGCQTPPEPGASRIVRNGAYRIRTDAPVTVYQLSPLTYLIDPPPEGCPRQCFDGPLLPCKSFSNDASLLFPATALTGNYVGISWPSKKNRAGFLAITATAADTRVRVAGRGQFMAGEGIDAAGNGEVVLGAGDVLELIADYQVAEGFGADLTGTAVRASRPVQVVGGHSCANIPEATTGYCDHLEEGLFPIETLGTDYVVTRPGAVSGASPHVVRIVAVSEATHLTFEPAVHADAIVGPSDAPLQFSTDRDFRVASDRPIIVAQYMQGSTSVPSGQGDPSISLAIPTAQFRASYRFVASHTYDANFVNIIAREGASIMLDGVAVSSLEFIAIGTSGYAVARKALTASSDVHSIESVSSFGIVVYGYGQDTSYMYPGGLDLNRITPPPIH